MSTIQVIFLLLAGLFAVLFVIFIYYLWNEKVSDEDALLPVPDKLAPERARTTTDDTTGLSANDIPLPTVAKEPLKQVFNVSQNRFTYKEAPAVCKALGAELATLEQLADGYRKGADWCNYGWTEGQMAFYPTQKKLGKNYKRTQHLKEEICVVNPN